MDLINYSYFFRYDNKGCGRSYLSQRDLDAHIAYRHKKDKSIVQLPAAPPPPLAPLPNISALQGFFPTPNNPRVCIILVI